MGQEEQDTLSHPFPSINLGNPQFFLLSLSRPSKVPVALNPPYTHTHTHCVIVFSLLSSPLVANFPLMRSSGEQILAWGWRRRGLEWGECPHPSSRFRALSGAQSLSAAGKHPGIADGGRKWKGGKAELISFSPLCLSACVFF